MQATITQLRASKASRGESKIIAYLSDAESEANLKRAGGTLLLPGIEIRRGNILSAIRDLQTQRSPDTLIVDMSGIDMPVSAMESLAQVCEPDVRVVAIGDRNDVGLYRELRNLGVAEYLFKPITAEFFTKMLERVSTGATTADPSTRKGKIVAVTGARGGVGATTVAVNVAAYLADTVKRRVALIDLDVYTGTVALMLNLKPGQGLRDALEDPDRVDDLFLDRVLQPVSERLSVLASEEPIADGVETRPEGLQALIRRLQTQYHFVIIDVPQVLTAATRWALESAQVRLLVCDGTLASARDVVRLREAFDTEAVTRKSLVILNRLGAPGSLKPGDVMKALGGQADHTLEYRPRPLFEAATYGIPAIRKDAKFRSVIAGIAQEVSGHKTEISGLRRFFRR